MKPLFLTERSEFGGLKKLYLVPENGEDHKVMEFFSENEQLLGDYISITTEPNTEKQSLLFSFINPGDWKKSKLESELEIATKPTKAR